MANKNNELQSLIKQGVVKQVPLDVTKGRVRYGHSDGYFVRADGGIALHTFAPSQINSKGGSAYPGMRECIPRPCHVIMAITFYGIRPVFTDEKGRTYGGICHHIIPDKLNYRPANLLCWLTKEEHREADRRQRALRKLVPDGNLYVCSYDLLRALQDPRTMPAEDFEHAMDVFRFLNEQVPIHWQTFQEVDYLRWFYMPFEEFKAELIKGLGPLVGPEQMMKESFYDKD